MESREACSSTRVARWWESNSDDSTSVGRERRAAAPRIAAKLTLFRPRRDAEGSYQYRPVCANILLALMWCLQNPFRSDAIARRDKQHSCIEKPNSLATPEKEINKASISYLVHEKSLPELIATTRIIQPCQQRTPPSRHLTPDEAIVNLFQR